MRKACIDDEYLCTRLINGSNYLDNTENIFLDNCHLNSEGNYIIANNIAKNISNLLNKNN